MSRPRLLLLLVVLALIAVFFASGLHQQFTLEQAKLRQAELVELFARDPLPTAAIYFGVYVAVTSLSLPGAALMTVLGGAIFGLLWGTVIVSLASSVGASLAFLASRFLFRDLVQRRYGHRLVRINRGFERDGGLYLFTLRLVPVMPFFVVNLLMGLTPVRLPTFFWVSQVGMLAGTVVYVNVGTQLAQLHSLADVATPGLLGSLAALGLLPLCARRVIEFLRARRVYAGFRRPARFERNLVVIGAGSAGLVSAYIAAAVRAKVTLIERDRMGGDCLNTGCVPSKALIRSSRLLAQARQASRLGLGRVDIEFRFSEVMERVQQVVRQVEPHDSVARYSALGVECLHGDARIVSPWEVEVRCASGDAAKPADVRRISTRNIIVAAGARPRIPMLPGIEEIDYLTSDTVWNLRELPDPLLVLGGGPIGCELAQAFSRFGGKVILVERGDRLLAREDDEVSRFVQDAMLADGVDVRLGHEALRFERRASGAVLHVSYGGQAREIPFDRVLCALGRQANVQGYGLEELGIRPLDHGPLETDEFLRTSVPNIYAAGDVASRLQFTHAASHMAWHATVNALFGGFRRFAIDWSALPWCTFTDPEVARVGLNERQALEQGVAFEVTRFELDELDRAIADGVARGFLKVLTVPGSDRILGATIVGEHAGELIGEFVTAMRHGLGLGKILATIHVYPTFSEANKYLAGQWKREHAPVRILSWLEHFHAWRRR